MLQVTEDSDLLCTDNDIYIVSSDCHVYLGKLNDQVVLRNALYQESPAGQVFKFKIGPIINPMSGSTQTGF